MRRLFLLPSLLLTAGCVTVPPDQLQREITQTVEARAAQPVDWGRGSPEDLTMREAMRRMLADRLTLDEAVAIVLVNNRELRAQLARAQVVGA